jgi:hypothetical protein
MKRFLILPLLLLCSCATLPSPGTSPFVQYSQDLIAAKHGIILAAQTADGLCKNQVLNAQDCQSAKLAYESVAPVWLAGATCLIEQQASATGDPATCKAKLQALTDVYNKIKAYIGGAP